MRNLIALEWRRLRRETLYWIALCLCVGALWHGLSNGLAWRQFQQDGIRRAAAIGAEGIAAAKAKAAELNADASKQIDFWVDPRSGIGFEGAYLRLYDCLSPAPLAALAVGQSDLLPYCVQVKTGPWPNFDQSDEWENPVRLLLGRFDCAFAIIYLLPLLALLVSFNLFSREREQGTLPLLLSYPVSPRLWLAVCFLLRATVFLGLILAALTAGLFVAGFTACAPDATSDLLFWLAIILAYGGFWFALAFAVNAESRSSETNALILVGCWLALVILLPAGLNLALKQIYPLPSRVEFIDSLRAASAQAEKKGSGLLQKYLHDHPDLASGDKKENENQFIETLIAVNAETERLLNPAKRRFRDQTNRQLEAIERLSALSPAIVFQRAANALSGNDQTRHMRFIDAVEAHRDQVKRFLDPSFASEAPFTGYDDVPAFAYEQRTNLQNNAQGAFGALLLLLAPSALLAAWGWRRLRRPLLER